VYTSNVGGEEGALVGGGLEEEGVVAVVCPADRSRQPSWQGTDTEETKAQATPDGATRDGWHELSTKQLPCPVKLQAICSHRHFAKSKRTAKIRNDAFWKSELGDLTASGCI